MNKFMFALCGLVCLLAGMFLPVDLIVSRGLPADYSEYASNYTKGLNLFRGLLMGGGLLIVVASRHLAQVFGTDPSGLATRPYAVSRGELFSILGVSAAGAILCLKNYTQGFTFDEVFLVTAIITENPIKMFVHPSGSAHVLNSLPANLLAHVFGASEAVCRLPALIAAVLTPAAIWAFGRRVFSPRVGLIAAVIVCFSPIHIWYAQEAKGNAWLMLLVPVSWYLISRLAEHWKCSLAIGYWLCLFLISLSHLSGIMFILATVPVFLLPQPWRPFRLNAERGRYLVTLHLLAAWAALMFYAPIIPFMMDFSKIAHVNEGSASLFPLCWELLEQFTAMDQPWWCIIPCGILVLAGLWMGRTAHRGLLVFFVLPFVIDLVITIGLQLFSFPRYHMYVFPWLVLLMAMALSSFHWKSVVPYACGVALVGYGMALADYYDSPKSNLKMLASLVLESDSVVSYVVGGNQKSYPASGIMYYTDRFETDETIGSRIEGLPSDELVNVFVIDTMQFETAYAPFAAKVESTGTRRATFQCLGELDQFRVRTSYWFQIEAGNLTRALGEIPGRK